MMHSFKYFFNDTMAQNLGLLELEAVHLTIDNIGRFLKLFAFWQRRQGNKLLLGESIYSLSQQALEQYYLKDSPSSFIDDIVKITCLIIRDGEEYRFIHKTVQEYYTASYIKKKPEHWAMEFYNRFMNSDAHFAWDQELEFYQK